MTLHRLMPSEVEAESFADLWADARAIPRAAFTGRSEAMEDENEPVELPVAIPDTTVSLVEAADHQWADYRR